MADSDLEDEPEAPTPEDPMRAMRRLAQAILLQACLDLIEPPNPDTWSNARRFLYPDEPGRQEFLRWTIEVSALDPYRLRKNLIRVRRQITAPGFQLSRSKPITAEFHTCQQCGVLPVAEFNISRHSAAGLTDLCRGCLKDKTRDSKMLELAL